MSDERTTHAGDPVLFTTVLVLAVLGVLTVYTSSAGVALASHGSPHHHVLRHLAHLGLGVAALAFFWIVPYRALDRSRVVNVLWLLSLAALVFTLFQPEVAGARRWIRLDGLSVQPSEPVKLVVILLSAFQLSRRRDRLGDPWRGVLPPLLLVGQLAVLVAIQPDFGTAALLLSLLGLLAFVAGTPMRLMAGFGAAASGLLALHLIQEPYRLARLRAFLDPAFEPLGANFQLRQSFIAIGSGGFFGRTSDGLLGTGFGCSLQKLFFLPEPHTDFVYAVVGEELGLLGTLSVLALFGVLVFRGLRIAAAAPCLFGSLVATGATAVLGFQALANLLVVVGLLPTKGLPLPFLSAGGSSLVTSCAAAGLLLSVSRHG